MVSKIKVIVFIGLFRMHVLLYIKFTVESEYVLSTLKP